MLALKALKASYVAFINCRPALMVQFNTVHDFRGPGELHSFYLSYVCDSCGHYFESLLDAIASQIKAAPPRKVSNERLIQEYADGVPVG